MVAYHDLIKANLTPLDEAVQKWATLPGKIRQVGTNFRNQLETPLTRADWEGDAGDAALKKVRSIAKQLAQWGEEADDIRWLLDDAHTKFKSAQKTLKGYKKIIDEDKNLSIDEQGRVTYKAANADELDPTAEGIQAKEYAQVVADYNRYIQAAVSDATTADDVLSWILSQDFNGRDRGFTGDGYHSIKDGVAGREKALKDLDAVVRVASSKEAPAPEELKKANAILARHEGDPLFAEKFATRLGAKGTLEFWELATDDTEQGDARAKELQRLQKSLGFTLATASHSDSDAMLQWKREIIELGPKRISKEGSFGKPYGFQLMSSLLKNGNYDADFLVDYGKGIEDPHSKDGRKGGLLEFDRKHKDDLKDFWESDWEKPYLDFDRNADQGVDPMGGYMEALGNNPEAAQDVFHQKDYLQNRAVEPNTDLVYLLNEREWPDEAGLDNLGHALEAAALGHPHGQPELGLHRDKDSANVASQVITLIGDDRTVLEPGFLGEKSALADSMAKIGAGYIDDINHGVDNFGDTTEGRELRDSAFRHSGPEHISVRNATAIGFLGEVGGTEQGYSILSSAQHQFTTSALIAHSEPNDELAKVIETGAKTQGVLNEARSNMIQENIDDTKENEGKTITESAEWKKALISQGIGVVTGMAAAPFGGPTTSAAVAVGVPTLIETGAGLIESATGFSIDGDTERKIKEMEERVDIEGVRTKKDFHTASEIRAANPLDVYAALHPQVTESTWFDETKSDVETAYNNGRSALNARDKD
ncbi:DUF6571 family protein [Streptomyces sp. NPDC018031]|uniref:DUF6571 family protein n=1 Tax=Streptomyces sp. NPDC018031 TaxID=3365033 RepID=UPI00379D673A